MVKKLTLAEQRKLIKALPAHRMTALKAHCRKCEMKGEGILDIIKSVGKVLGGISADVGPTVLKELVLPLLKQKLFKGKGRKPRKKRGAGLSPGGRGLTLPGGRGLGLPGSGLRLAGQRIPRRR